jgi:hypothetical protein
MRVIHTPLASVFISFWFEEDRGDKSSLLRKEGQTQ